MTEYTFIHDFCSKCRNPNFCIVWIDGKYCNDCFNWKTNIHANTKDEVKLLMIDCGIEDLEN